MILYKNDCKYFRGYIPCRPHKENGYHCDSCPEYLPKKDKILIIKLGAIGDVIRTTPLLHKFWKLYPESEIWWLTLSPEVLPDEIDKILKFSPESILLLQSVHFSKIYNFDKDDYACALMNMLSGDEKTGFYLTDGKPAPISKSAEHKYLTGLFDDVNKANTKSYMEEIFEICGWQFGGEEYLLNCDKSIKWDIPCEGKKIVGLNTGCGDRWVSRLWDDKNWISLTNMLLEDGYFPMLLGGSQEHDKNMMFAEKTGAYYPGHFSLKDFISLMDQCDAVVTAVTMGMHLAVGLKKQVILMNNIFNPHEFELYGRGELIEPEKECKCFFSPKCKNDEYFCMDHLKAETIFESVKKHLDK